MNIYSMFSPKKFVLVALGTLLTLSGLRAENPLLSVDFNAGGGTSTPTQDGFEPINITVGEMEGPLSLTFNPPGGDYSSGITMSLACGQTEEATGRFTARHWKAGQDEGEYTFSSMYSDAILGIGGQQFILSFTGLKPGKDYQVRFYFFSAKNPGLMELTDISSGQNAEVAQLAWDNKQEFSSTTSSDIFSVPLLVQASPEGKAVIRILNKEGSPFLNGFQLSENAGH
jgi:hypothetical protein